jgi:hypothetical protein
MSKASRFLEYTPGARMRCLRHAPRVELSALSVAIRELSLTAVSSAFYPVVPNIQFLEPITSNDDNWVRISYNSANGPQNFDLQSDLKDGYADDFIEIKSHFPIIKGANIVGDADTAIQVQTRVTTQRNAT